MRMRRITDIGLRLVKPVQPDKERMTLGFLARYKLYVVFYL